MKGVRIVCHSCICDRLLRAAENNMVDHGAQTFEETER
jgi:hypothetical protein